MAKKVYVITGPIGSGKSTAIKYLKNKGFSTVDLDKVSNEILGFIQNIQKANNSPLTKSLMIY